MFSIIQTKRQPAHLTRKNASSEQPAAKTAHLSRKIASSEQLTTKTAHLSQKIASNEQPLYYFSRISIEYFS